MAINSIPTHNDDEDEDNCKTERGIHFARPGARDSGKIVTITGRMRTRVHNYLSACCDEGEAHYSPGVRHEKHFPSFRSFQRGRKFSPSWCVSPLVWVRHRGIRANAGSRWRACRIKNASVRKRSAKQSCGIIVMVWNSYRKLARISANDFSPFRAAGSCSGMRNKFKEFFYFATFFINVRYVVEGHGYGE